MKTFPECLLGHPRFAYFADGQLAGHYPAMLAPVVGPDGRLESVHRTYLADVEPCKKLMTPVTGLKGSAVRLFPAGECLGIAEGIETAIAAHELFNVPVWAALSTSLMESWAPPPGVRDVIVFGDNDNNFAGQKAAYAVASRLANRVGASLEIPP